MKTKQIIELVLTVILYFGVEFYEIIYEKLEDEFEYATNRKQRRLIRNIAGVLLIALDVLIMVKTRYIFEEPLKLKVIFFAAGAVIPLHILGSIFAMAYSVKGYTAIDIISHIVKLAVAITVFCITFFSFERWESILPPWVLPAAYGSVLLTRSMRMMNGKWMNLRLEDIMRVEDSYIAQAELELAAERENMKAAMDAAMEESMEESADETMEETEINETDM